MMKITLGRLRKSTENERIHDMSFSDAGRPAVLRTKRNNNGIARLSMRYRFLFCKERSALSTPKMLTPHKEVI